jgi:dihydrofolate reductase
MRAAYPWRAAPGSSEVSGMTTIGRRVRYQVAASLDGYIAGPQGEYDWIVMDPDIDFAALAAQFDTYLMGRNTYEMMRRDGHTVDGAVYVFSRTLRQRDHPGVTIVASEPEGTVLELKTRPGKDIWLWGGGRLFHSLLELGLVNRVEIAVVPALLGAGIPLLPGPALRRSLTLESHRLYPKSGIVLLEYAVNP